MDEDDNGFLDGTEMTKLAMWVFDSFHPGGQPIAQADREREAAKLLTRIDKNGDGVLEFAEFAQWFTKTCEGIKKFRMNQARNDKDRITK